MIQSGPSFTAVAQVLASLKTEILLFVFAVGVHVFLTGNIIPSRRSKRGCEPRKQKPSLQEVGKQGSPKNNRRARGAAGEERSSLQPVCNALQNSLEPLLRAGAGVSELEAVLGQCPSEQQADVFLICLRSVGLKSASRELLSAMAVVARKGGRKVPAILAENILQAHLDAQRMDDFDEVLQYVEDASSMSSSIGLLELRAAIQRSDATAALQHLGRLRALWEVKSASSAPQSLLQQLAELATKCSSLQLLEAVLELLPSAPSVRLAAAVLRALQALVPPGEVNEAVACAFRKYFGAVDFSTDGQTERMLLDLAMQDGFGDLLSSLLLSSLRGPKQAAFLRGCGLKEALQIFQACEESAGNYNALLENCLRHKDLSEADRQMTAAMRSGAADVVTYNTMIKAHLQRGSRDSARRFLTSMKSSGIKPTIVTYNEFLDDLISRDGGSSGAWAVVDDMLAAGVRPNRVSCSILLKSTLSKAWNSRDMARVMELVEQVDDDTDEVLLSSVVEACVRTNRVEMLRRYLRSQKARMNDVITAKNAHTYGSLIRGFGVVSDLDGIWNAWREMKKRRVKVTSITLGCMVEALCCNGEVDAASNLVKEMKQDPETRPVVNAVIHCSVLKGYAQQKRFDRVWSIFNELQTEPHLELSIVTFNTLVDACARNREMGRIPQVLDCMVKSGIEPNLITYSAIIKGYCQDNKLDQAFELLDSMKKTTNFVPDEVMYNSLVDGCARQGLYAKGMRLFDDMLAAGVAPTNYTMSVLVKLAGRSRKLDRAFEFCHELPAKFNFRLNIHVYNNLMQACMTSKDIDRAVSVLTTMLRERVKPDQRTYRLLCIGCVEHNALEKGSAILRAACGLGAGQNLPSLAAFGADELRPAGGAPYDVVTEVLEVLFLRDRDLAVKVAQDLAARCPGFRMSHKLKMQVAKCTLPR